jgi:hypothetical protein
MDFQGAGLPSRFENASGLLLVRFCDRGIAFQYQTVTKEIVMKLDSKSGATLAAAAATLFLAGAVVSTGSTTANAADGKCMAANACKGQSACKGGPNACKGLNACKGQGFAKMSEAKCKAAGGAFVKT